MLLLYQSGSVKIGEVVRYTVTYTPAHDRILPSPPKLYVKIKNTSTIALRAAFVRGPYTLYAAAYPSTFNPNEKFENHRRFGVPEFEPYLKAGGVFSTELLVPEDVQKTAGTSNRDGRPPGWDDGEVKSVSWIIEVASQVIFSNSASVRYDILLGRDEKSLALGFAIGGGAPPTPGQVTDHQQSQGAKDGHHSAQARGVYSRAIKLTVDDTASLWNTPRMPEWDDGGKERPKGKSKDAPVESVTNEPDTDVKRQERQKKVHLVILTHGLHSNLGSDMLYLKEHIDATAKQAKVDARARRAKKREEESQAASSSDNGNQQSETDQKRDENTRPSVDGTDIDDDEEEVIVRGFSGNAVRTEKGIKYLGKRLAKYLLAVTYPDQPYRPVAKKAKGDASSQTTRIEKVRADPAHISTNSHTSVEKEPYDGPKLAYKITSISFIAHSLGGLIQTYAVAYIQKHAPEFFDTIKPINFIALATPFLGLSNENPLYVKFALDFGLVGRTGQDLGLTWRAPTLARSGWGAIVSSMGEGGQKKADGKEAPESKPLLRILPTGPAHIVLKKFRNRTVYSNVVNDGIVPLRTSCLLFLDWQGLGRVEKARRENGLVGRMAEWGWAEITGQNSVSPMRHTMSDAESSEDLEENFPTRQGHGGDVPQPPPSATSDDDARSLRTSRKGLPVRIPSSSTNDGGGDFLNPHQGPAVPRNNSPLASFMGLFRPNPTPKQRSSSPKQAKIYKRSQTIKMDSDSSVPTISTSDTSVKDRLATTGYSNEEDFEQPPPTTTIFESASDVLKPPLPSVEYLLNPSSRPRTIFHDRVYHPRDIPPPPLKRRPSSALTKRRSSFNSKADNAPSRTLPHHDSSLSSRDYDDTKNTNPDKHPLDVIDSSAMKVEEKIARAYHRDLSWRKVLVRLEPDAHNNMIVRRMFANAYGWPVVKHLCDTHFGDTAAALTPDDEEGDEERAKDGDEGPDSRGGETKDPEIKPLTRSDRTDSEIREATDEVPELDHEPIPNALRKALQEVEDESRPSIKRSGTDLEAWDERYWSDSVEETDEEGDYEAKHKSAETHAHAKPATWTWTDVIAGKGGLHSPKSAPPEIDKFLRNIVPGTIPSLTSEGGVAAESSSKVASSHPNDG
jgi:hypothetical protein